MNNRNISRNLPKCIERLVDEGYNIDIEHCKKFIRITCEGNALRNLIPFGQMRLTEFGGNMGITVPSFRMLLNLIVSPMKSKSINTRNY